MNIVVFGDSITQGYDDYEAGGWVNRLFRALSARQDTGNLDYISVFNLGIDGNTTRDVKARIAVELKARVSIEKTITMFDIGGNDAAPRGVDGTAVVPLSEFTDNYATLLREARTYGPVVCLGLHESDGVVSETVTAQYDEVIEGLAKQYGAHFISMRGILGADFAALTYDGDHPSPAGHELIFARVKHALEAAKLIPANYRAT